MSKLLSITALIAISTLTGVIIATATPEPPHDVVTLETIQHPPAEYEALTAGPTAIESLVNSERIANNIAILKSSKELRQSACEKAQHMVDYNYWSHTAPDGTEPWYFIEKVYDYTAAGENLAKNFNSQEEIVSGWMNSETHKANILGDFTHQGICTVDNITVQHLAR